MKRFATWIRILVFLSLIATATFLFCACEEEGIPPSYDPTQITQSGTSLQTQTGDETQTGDGTEPGENTQIGEDAQTEEPAQTNEEEVSSENSTTPSDSSAPDTASETTVNTDLEADTEDLSTGEDTTTDTGSTETGSTSDLSETGTSGTPSSNDDDLDEFFAEEIPDYSDHFDLLREINGLHPYVDTTEITGYYPLWVQMRSVGHVVITVDGGIAFTADFKEKTSSLWGGWDKQGHLFYYVYFVEQGVFTEIKVISSGSTTVAQMNLSYDELDALLKEPKTEETPDQTETPEGEDASSDQGEEAPEDPTGTPDSEEESVTQDPSQETGSDEETGEELGQEEEEPSSEPETSTDPEVTGPETPSSPEDEGATEENTDPQEDPSEDLEEESTRVTAAELLPRTSAAYDFLSDLQGAASDLALRQITEDWEEYSFVLDLDASEWYFLTKKIEPIQNYCETTNKQEDYHAQTTLNGIHFTFMVHIDIGSSWRATVSVLGVGD